MTQPTHPSPTAVCHQGLPVPHDSDENGIHYNIYCSSQWWRLRERLKPSERLRERTPPLVPVLLTVDGDCMVAYRAVLSCWTRATWRLSGIREGSGMAQVRSRLCGRCCKMLSRSPRMMSGRWLGSGF